MSSFPKILVVSGILLILTGLVWHFGSKILPIGRLPGDIALQKGNMRFYFPLATCLLISALLSLVFWIIRQINR